jgi:hypothetical protein
MAGMLEDIRCDVWSKIGGEMIDLGRALMGIIHVALNARAARDGRTDFRFSKQSARRSKPASPSHGVATAVLTREL